MAAEGRVLRGLMLCVSVVACAALGPSALAQTHVHPHHHSLAARVGRLVKVGRCKDAVDLALNAGDLDLAAKVRNLCEPPASGPDSAASPAPAEPQPPKSLTAEDVQAWAIQHVDAPGWVLVDYDQDGLHLVKAASAELTPDKTLRILGREELFRPAERSGVLARSDRQDFEVDCSAKRFRLLSMDVFSSNNLSGSSQHIAGPLTDWLDAAPGTHRAAQVGQLCQIGLKTASASASGRVAEGRALSASR